MSVHPNSSVVSIVATILATASTWMILWMKAAPNVPTTNPTTLATITMMAMMSMVIPFLMHSITVMVMVRTVSVSASSTSYFQQTSTTSACSKANKCTTLGDLIALSIVMSSILTPKVSLFSDISVTWSQ